MSKKLGFRIANFVEGREDAFIYGMQSVYIAAAIICALGSILTTYRLFGKIGIVRGGLGKE